jgi:hypothetical protein
MKDELISLESERQEAILKKAEQILTIRVLNGLCGNQECPTPFCTAHPK